MKLLFLTVTLFALMPVSQAQDAQDTFKVMKPEELANLLKKTTPEITVIDLRSPSEYARGHIMTAINLDENDIRFLQYLDRLNKKRNYVVYSSARNLNNLAIHLMRQNNFTGIIYNLSEGYEGWVRRNLPTEM